MILLLDIDGVLETSPSWKKPEFLEDNFYKFDENSQKNFIEIIDKINPEIILTTTHRINYNLMEWNQIFELRGIHVDKISKINDAKKAIDIKKRNVEIEEWFSNNKTAEFLILDDDKSLNELTDNLKNRWIQIDSMLGITESIKNQILEKINNFNYRMRN
ncbi:HAD domain-containing protein [Acinetobacter sp. VNH17]|uniref:HAD domain-containing protein n=1 Tax=Acinetobacter thutiue TaxID=2998078 RepID=A0ABT7WS69_9GAMM|nr:HAD domain-containing protein [Acinetobacter thutiue]MCY6413430.1 HAD domain-containing protein [Acinetobacter thutiue]MDN0015539.1 HAD domain-containing protein [Acinetobacter thutiue]